MKRMSFLQETIGKYLLAISAKQTNRTVVSSNFTTAKSIGIIYDAIDQDMHQKVAAFGDAIMKSYNSNVSMLGFMSNPELKSCFAGQFGCKHFSKQDFTWYGTANNVIITDFINSPFDILIDLSVDSIYPLQYVSKLSQAMFKIGRLDPNFTLDMMIDIEKEKNIDYLMNQIHTYILMLK